MPEQPIRWSTFVQARFVMDELATEPGLARAVELLRAAGVSKVYLDLCRGVRCSEEVLVRARDYLRAEGLEVAAGITTVAGPGIGAPSSHGLYWLCYSAPETIALLEELMRRAARLFDEIIVDDFLCTMCRCERCEAARGSRSRAQFYAEQMVEVTRRHMLEPARAENPAVRITIKYPQWYDRFHCFGYEIPQQIAQFDRVWAGTETRDLEVEYVPQYQAFDNYRWLAANAGEKMGGAWFDQINTSPEVYVEQAYQSVLAGAPEITLFHYSPAEFAADNPCMTALRAEQPRLQRLAGLIQGKRPLGIPALKPAGSDGGDETWLYDYLGMFGLPTWPAPELPAEAQVAIFPRQAAGPNFAGELRAFLQGGGTALVTAGALAAIDDWRLVVELGFAEHPTDQIDTWACRFQVGAKRHDGPGWVRFGRRLSPVGAQTVAAAVGEAETFPILTERAAFAGRALVLSARTVEYGPDSTRVTIKEPAPLLHLADGVVQELRDRLLAPLGLQVQMPGRIGLYLFEGGPIVLESFRDTPAQVKVTLEPGQCPFAGQRLRDLLGDVPVRQEGNCYRLRLERRSVVALGS